MESKIRYLHHQSTSSPLTPSPSPADYDQPMPRSIKQTLVPFFDEYNAKLFQLLHVPHYNEWDYSPHYNEWDYGDVAASM